MTFREIQSPFSPRFLCLVRDLDRDMLTDVEGFQEATLMTTHTNDRARKKTNVCLLATQRSTSLEPTKCTSQ